MNAQKTLTTTALALTLTCSTTHCMLRHALAQTAARSGILRIQIPAVTQHIQPRMTGMFGIHTTKFNSDTTKEKEDAKTLETEKTKFTETLAEA